VVIEVEPILEPSNLVEKFVVRRIQQNRPFLNPGVLLEFDIRSENFLCLG